MGFEVSWEPEKPDGRSFFNQMTTAAPSNQATGVSHDWMRRPEVWLVVALLAFVLFPWSPMALRWPLRIAVWVAFIGAGWLSFRRVRTSSAENRAKRGWRELSKLSGAGLLMFVLEPFVEVKRKQVEGKLPGLSASVSVERIAVLNAELKSRGIELAVLPLPEFRHLFPEARKDHEFPVWMERFVAKQALKRVSSGGTPVYDLFPLFEKYASREDQWHRDKIHLTTDTIEAIAGDLAKELDSRGLGQGAESNRKIVIMGNCFAGQFAEAKRRELPEWSRVRALTSQGDRGRVADFLYLFPGEYLEETELVIWVMPYDLLASATLPPLKTEPQTADAAIRSVDIKVTSTLGWRKQTSVEKLASLPYPNGLVELTGVVVDEREHFTKGQEIQVYGYGVRDREVEPLGRFSSGRTISVHLIPFDAHVAKNPKLATEYIINDSGRFDLERYWVDTWTFVR